MVCDKVVCVCECMLNLCVLVIVCERWYWYGRRREEEKESGIQNQKQESHKKYGENTTSVSTPSNVSFCGTYGCSNLSLSSHRWVLGKWMSKNPNFKSNDDGDEEDDDDNDFDDDDGHNNETLRRGCSVKKTYQAYGENSLWGRERGEGVPFSWSFRDKGSSPPLCFAKWNSR